MSRSKTTAMLLLVLGAAACADGATPLGPVSPERAPADPSATIYDGGHTSAAYNMKFFFLPPMVENFKDDKKATDGTLSPVVEVCVLTSANVCGTLVDRFTTTSGGRTNEKVRWLGNHYQVNFRSSSYSLNSTKKYRVTVLVNGLVMGWADAMFVNNRDQDRDRGRGEVCRDDGHDGRDDDYDGHHGGDDHHDGHDGRDDDDDDDHDGHNGGRYTRYNSSGGGYDGHGGHDDDDDHHDGHSGHDDDDDCGGGSSGTQQYVTLSCNETLPIKFRIGFGVAAAIKLTPPTQTVAKGKTAQYAAVVTDLHNLPVNAPITWSSSDTTIAKVGPTGLVTTYKTGTVTITARAERAVATATLIVTPSVVRVEVTSVVLGIGGTRTLVAKAYDGAGNLVTGVPVTWSIRNADGSIATITSTSGVATGLTPGVAVATATIEGVSGTGTATVTPNIELATICNGNGLQYFGSTTVLPTGTCGLRLTPAEVWTAGSAWSTTKQRVVGGFETRFAMRFSSPGPADLLVQGNTEPGADGIVFVLQNMSGSALGGQGIGLGYQGMTSSLAVEFDTWLNPGEGDPNGNHLSIHTNGVGANNAAESYSIGSVVLPGDLYDNRVHDVVIRYVPGLITVSLDGVLLLTAPLNLASVNGNSILDADGKAWAGFTSATGGAYGIHDILSWSLNSTL